MKASSGDHTWKVAMYPRRGHIDPAVSGLSRLPHEQRIARCGRVVYEPLAIAGPIELGCLLEIRPQWSAVSRRGQKIYITGLRAIRSPCPD